VSDGTTTELNAWLARLRAGDPQARDALIGRALERLRALARRQLGDFARIRRFDDTDDVLQTAVVRLLRRLRAETPADAAAFFAAAARETRCTLIDLARSRFGPLGPGRNETAPPEAHSTGPPPAADPAHSTSTPDRLADWTEFHEQVGRLPDDERAVFELLWYQGLTQPEAAGVLGVSEATVKRRWLAARVRLQGVLFGRDPAP
jgi:RNA polymerase sigma factor (sigma-70 family)